MRVEQLSEDPTECCDAEDLAISNHDEPLTRARSGRSILVPSCFLVTMNVEQSEWKEEGTDISTSLSSLLFLDCWLVEPSMK